MSKPVFLRIFKGTELVGVKQMTSDQVVFGREGEVDIKLEDNSVSPIHALIEKRETGFYVSDLGSEAGTTVNGAVTLDQALKSQDQIKMGIFEIEFFLGIPKPKSTPPKTQHSSEAQSSDEDEIVPAPFVEQAAPIGPVSDRRPPTTVVVETVAPAPTSKPKVPSRAPASSPGETIIASGGEELIVPVVASPRTFAPGSAVKDLRETIHPGKGTIVEVILGWHDRVLKTFHFERQGGITVGSHPKNDIVLPPLGGVRISHLLIQWETAPVVIIPSEVSGEVTKSGQTESIESLVKKGQLVMAGTGYRCPLNQDEMIRLEFQEGVCLYIRFATATFKPIAAPILGLTQGELTALVSGAVILGASLIYMAFVSPNKTDEETQEDLLKEQRRAVFVYKRSEKSAAEQVAQTTVDTPKTQGLQSGNPVPQEGTKPAEAKPNNSNSTRKILTGQNVGKGNGSPQNQSSKGDLTKKGSPAPRPDVKKTGLLGVFGKSGTQNELEKAFQGADQVGTLGQSASGKTGLGVGDNANAKSPGLREVGQGGSGVATVGISGVGTKGKGGGNVGYGEGALGGKKGVQIVPGGAEEAFTGMIDREAIRRVIISRLREMKACYEKGLNRDPSLGGKIVLEWTIADQGRVSEAAVKSSTMNNSEVEQCALSRLRTWRFPEPPVGREAVVTYPFVFAAQN